MSGDNRFKDFFYSYEDEFGEHVYVQAIRNMIIEDKISLNVKAVLIPKGSDSFKIANLKQNIHWSEPYPFFGYYHICLKDYNNRNASERRLT